MKKPVTIKDAVEKTGKSEYWLRTHACMWCDQSALNAVRYGCGAIFDGKCNPMDKFKNPVYKTEDSK